mgnify:CR=1 FL=1
MLSKKLKSKQRNYEVSTIRVYVQSAEENFARGVDHTDVLWGVVIIQIADIIEKYGISIADVTTGDFLVTEVDSERKLLDEINKFSPSEIICNEAMYMSGADLSDLKNRLGITISSLDSWYFDDNSCEKVLKEHFDF